jgi:hypothetical protein
MKPPDDKQDFSGGLFTSDSHPSPFGQMTGKHPDFLFAPATL